MVMYACVQGWFLGARAFEKDHTHTHTHKERRVGGTGTDSNENGEDMEKRKQKEKKGEKPWIRTMLWLLTVV